jgi:hypothetical protein
VPGGQSSASAVVVQVLGADIASDLQVNLQAYGSANSVSVGVGGDVEVEVALEGTLTNGQTVTSETFDFPLHFCLDCDGVSPTSCIDGQTAAPSGHGPCCEPQDFSEECLACGGVGQPCCAMPQGVVMICSSDSDCTQYGLGGQAGDCFIPAGATSGTCLCQDVGTNSDCTAFGESSVCGSQGTCTPGCNGAGVVCAAATALPAGSENCSYLNSGALTSVCANGP